MTTLILADPHFSANPRDAYRLEFLHKRLPEMLLTYKVTQTYILGDVCEAKDEHSAYLVNQVVDGIAKIHFHAPVTMLMGNHDYLQQGEPFFRFMRNVPGLRYISKPVLRKHGHMFLPFTRDPKKDWASLSPEGVERIFTHMTFEGATGGFGHKLEGPKLSLLPDVPIISGDVHVPQKIDNLTYVGAPYTVDFGDDYIGRVLLLKDDRMSAVVVGGPQKRIVRAPNMAGCKRGDIVRVEVPIKAAEYSRWQERCDQIRAWAEEQGVYLDSIIPLISDASGVATKSIKRKAPASDDAVLMTYAKIKGIDKRTLETGRKLL